MEKEDSENAATIDISTVGQPFYPLLGGHSGNSQDLGYNSMDDPDPIESFNAQLRFDVDFNTVGIVSITTYQDFSGHVNGDFDVSELNAIDVHSEENNEAWSQEFQLLSQSDSPWNWVACLYYFESESDYFIELGATRLPNIGRIVLQPQSFLDTSVWAIFGQATYAFNDAWALTFKGLLASVD